MGTGYQELQGPKTPQPPRVVRSEMLGSPSHLAQPGAARTAGEEVALWGNKDTELSLDPGLGWRK